MPRHTRGIEGANSVVGVVANILVVRKSAIKTTYAEDHNSNLEVEHTGIVIILSREESCCKVGRVDILFCWLVEVPIIYF